MGRRQNRVGQKREPRRHDGATHHLATRDLEKGIAHLRACLKFEGESGPSDPPAMGPAIDRDGGTHNQT